MCIVLAPAALAALSIGTTVASAGLGLYGQVKAAQAQNDYYAENAAQATKAANDKYLAQQTQLNQERDKATQTLTQNSIKALQARATARTAAGEAGVTGLSVDALIDDYYGKQGQETAAVNQNYQMTYDYVLGSLKGTRSEAQSRINSVRRAEVGWADVAAAGVKVAAGATNAATTYKKMSAGNYGLGIDDYLYGGGAA